MLISANLRNDQLTGRSAGTGLITSQSVGYRHSQSNCLEVGSKVKMGLDIPPGGLKGIIRFYS